MIYFLTLIIFWKHTVVFYFKSILMHHNHLFCLIYKKSSLLILIYIRGVIISVVCKVST